MYIKGRLLRQQYIEEASLLEPEFNPEQVYIRSTNIKRTIATARCILAGMYGRDNLNKLPKAPVIHVERLEVDPLIPQTGSCRTLRQINHAAMIHGGDIPGIKEDRLLVEELLGIKEPDSDKKHKINFIDIRDDIAARETHGLLEVKSLAPLREVIEINASKVMFFAFCGQHEAEQQVAMQLSTGPVLKMLIETIDSSENDRTKFYLYSCHDSTLVGLLGALDVYDYQWPPFGADIRLEVYRRDGNQFIRVSYNGKDVKVRGCSSELCPFEEFKEAMGPYVINESQFRQICDSNILEEIAQEMLAQEKDEEEDEETAKRSDTPAGM
ncbi:hypothetical protein DPMN_031129 [Dreissena polymorpha]|uniref:Acid phosphatase n=1 Tax=Dreissena polymorpha TaxID=45954 RepID=A0A9D4M203_DREPO|nr:hypothetical protein DPMN_031129 [Dreissena polymorpha]